MNEICSLNLTALADALQKKEIGAEEATRACLDRIAATEERVGALLHVDAEGALARARQLDAQGPDASQPLWGVPRHRQGRPVHPGHAHHCRFPHPRRLHARVRRFCRAAPA